MTKKSTIVRANELRNLNISYVPEIDIEVPFLFLKFCKQYLTKFDCSFIWSNTNFVPGKKLYPSFINQATKDFFDVFSDGFANGKNRVDSHCVIGKLSTDINIKYPYTFSANPRQHKDLHSATAEVSRLHDSGVGETLCVFALVKVFKPNVRKDTLAQKVDQIIEESDNQNSI